MCPDELQTTPAHHYPVQVSCSAFMASGCILWPSVPQPSRAASDHHLSTSMLMGSYSSSDCCTKHGAFLLPLPNLLPAAVLSQRSLLAGTIIHHWFLLECVIFGKQKEILLMSFRKLKHVFTSHKGEGFVLYVFK